MRSALLQLMGNMPAIARRQALVQLFQTTAAAFSCDLPRLRGLSREQCLREYAWFTVQHAGEALDSGEDLSGLQERLYRSAYRLGQMPGRLLDVRSVEDVMAVGHLLYSILDIEFNGSRNGEFTIPHCYFSSYYSPGICRVMSAMDRGLFAGLAGAGSLDFTQRITERQACCRGRFTLTAGSAQSGHFEEGT